MAGGPGWLEGTSSIEDDLKLKEAHVIEFFDVTQHYGVRPVLRGISLRIEQGEVVTILLATGWASRRCWE